MGYTIDHTSFKTGKPADTGTPEGMGDVAWWEESDETKRCGAFTGVVKSLAEDQEFRSQMNLIHARLYGNTEILGFGIRDYSRSSMSTGYTPRVNLNVIASATDALHAKITKSKPRPSFQTDGATWKMQQKARRLDKWCRGVFYETKIYRKGSDVFRDCEVFGTGGLKLVPTKKKRIQLERVFIDEILVDDADAYLGSPQQMFHRMKMHKGAVKRLARQHHKGEGLQEKLDKIDGTKPPDDTPTLKGFNDMIEVFEGWMLPDEDGNGGRHVIAVEGCEILCEDWKMKTFPFVWMRLFPRLLGFFGQGAAERLMGIQIELNRLMKSVSEQLRRKGKGRTYVRKGAGIPVNKIGNELVPVIEVNGDPNTAVLIENINAVAPEEFQQIQALYQKAFQEIGLSEMSVAAKKPSGLDAAVALREFSDIETERFVKPAQAYEDFYLDAAELCVEYMRVSGSKAYKVKVPSRRYTMEVDWADIDLDRDSYIMQMFPVSSLPQTPGARYQRVKEMMQDGFIDGAVARRLLDMPDIEAEEDLGNAALDDADAVVGYILDEDTPKLYPPEPYQNLTMLLQRATASYLFARHHGCDEKRLEMLRDLIDQTSKLIVPPPAPPTPNAMPAPALAAPSPAISGGINVNVEGNKPQPVAPPVTG